MTEAATKTRTPRPTHFRRVNWQESTYRLNSEYHASNWPKVAAKLASEYEVDSQYGYHRVELELWRIAADLRAKIHCCKSKDKTYYKYLAAEDTLVAYLRATYPWIAY